MRKNIRCFFYCFLIFSVLLTVSCSNNRKKNSNIVKDITPRSTDNIPIIESSIHRSNENVPQEASEAIVSSETVFSSLVPRDYSIIGVKWANLDVDDIEEAVVVVTKKGQDSVNVLIAKFNTNTERYFFLWQETTTIIRNSFISLHIYDINDDGRKEIIIEGSNENLQQQLTVFYLDTPSYNLRNYQNIFTISGVGGGDIELQLPQDSFSAVGIIVYQIDETKEVIEKKSYVWNDAISNFALLRNEVFSFEDQAKERVNTLNTRDTQVWLTFLNGLWVYEKDTQHSNSVENEQMHMLYFSNNAPELSVIKNDSMRFYQWGNRASRMFRANIGIQVQVSNVVLPDIFASLSIEVLSEKQISIALEKDEYSEAIRGVFTQVNVNDIIEEKYALFSLFEQYGIARKLKQIQEWVIGNKEDSNTDNAYVFSQDSVSIFVVNNNNSYTYRIFNIANEFFMELKHDELHRFYKFTNVHEIDFNDEESSFALLLQPYVITSSKAYPLDNANDILLKKSEVDS